MRASKICVQYPALPNNTQKVSASVGRETCIPEDPNSIDFHNKEKLFKKDFKENNRSLDTSDGLIHT